jgi:hypothetical protein
MGIFRIFSTVSWILLCPGRFLSSSLRLFLTYGCCWRYDVSDRFLLVCGPIKRYRFVLCFVQSKGIFAASLDSRVTVRWVLFGYCFVFQIIQILQITSIVQNSLNEFSEKLIQLKYWNSKYCLINFYFPHMNNVKKLVSSREKRNKSILIFNFLESLGYLPYKVWLRME